MPLGSTRLPSIPKDEQFFVDGLPRSEGIEPHVLKLFDLRAQLRVEIFVERLVLLSLNLRQILPVEFLLGFIFDCYRLQPLNLFVDAEAERSIAITV